MNSKKHNITHNIMAEWYILSLHRKAQNPWFQHQICGGPQNFGRGDITFVTQFRLLAIL